MRVELKISGGFAQFPGLARPLVLQASALSDDAAARLRGLCKAATAEAARHRIAPAESIPDGRAYRLTIADEAGTREIACADPLAEGPLTELIEFVREHGTR
jgi:hypothetical protein